MATTNEAAELFSETATHYDENDFTHNTTAEVDFLVAEFALPPGSRILDMGCGTGRHAVELARRGYCLTGVDIAAGMLAQARKAADNAGVAVTWIEADATHFVTHDPTAPVRAGNQARRDGQFRCRLLHLTADLLLAEHRARFMRVGGEGVDGRPRNRREGEVTALRLAVDGHPCRAAYAGRDDCRAMIGHGSR